MCQAFDFQGNEHIQQIKVAESAGEELEDGTSLLGCVHKRNGD